MMVCSVRVCYAPRQLLSRRKWLGIDLPYEDHFLSTTKTLCRVSVHIKPANRKRQISLTRRLRVNTDEKVYELTTTTNTHQITIHTSHSKVSSVVTLTLKRWVLGKL